MYHSIDLRLAVPPFVNILVHLLSMSDEGNSWNLDHPILNMSLLILAFFLFLFFVFFVEISLVVTLFAEPIRLQFGNLYFSWPLTVSLLASFLFTQPHFWYVYIICFCISPWLHSILDMLNRHLQKIHTFIIICKTQHKETSIAEPGSTTHSGVELNEVDKHYFLSDQQPTLEPPSSPHSRPELDEVDEYYLLSEQPISDHEYLEVIYGHA